MAKTHSHRTVVFDLDGTLLDTWPSLLQSIRAVAAPEATLDTDALRIALSHGISPMIELAATQINHAIDGASKAEFVNAVLKHYVEHTLINAVPFDGVSDSLEQLAASGRRLAICTNRDRASTLLLLTHQGWSRYFHRVHCLDDGLPAKPDPTSLLDIVKDCGYTPSETLFVGDSYVDARCAQASSIQFAGHRGGYHTSLDDLQPADLTYGHISELMHWLAA